MGNYKSLHVKTIIRILTKRQISKFIVTDYNFLLRLQHCVPVLKNTSHCKSISGWVCKKSGYVFTRYNPSHQCHARMACSFGVIWRLRIRYGWLTLTCGDKTIDKVTRQSARSAVCPCMRVWKWAGTEGGARPVYGIQYTYAGRISGVERPVLPSHASNCSDVPEAWRVRHGHIWCHLRRTTHWRQVDSKSIDDDGCGGGGRVCGVCSWRPPSVHRAGGTVPGPCRRVSSRQAYNLAPYVIHDAGRTTTPASVSMEMCWPATDDFSSDNVCDELAPDGATWRTEQCHSPRKLLQSHKRDVIIIIITRMIFMVLSSWHSHCESSRGSFDECRLSAEEAANPQTKPTDLDCESARKKWQLSSTSTIAILLLLSPRAHTYFTVPRKVEG